ncbi:ATP-binding cassette domain-containing protein [Streptomyces sp. NPDC049687]|uniref:ATP-binding cassette domain-containing protein n=1 Tax=Streptomyces sp. NPDC049687 TaxID=3365596 RepID=UPI003787B6CB
MAGSDEAGPTTTRNTTLRVMGLSGPDTGAPTIGPVTFDVDTGEMVTVVAPERAAVAALLHLLSGIVVPGAGTIEFDGVDVTAEPAHKRVRRGLGRSYPLRPLWAGMTVEDHLHVAVQEARQATCRPWLRDPVDQAVTDRLLTRTGLAGRGATPSSHLSAGEKRKLEVAIMLADDPRLALLDDPLTGVSRDEAEELAALIRSLRDEDGHTIVMTALPESLDLLEPLSDRVVVLARRPADHVFST